MPASKVRKATKKVATPTPVKTASQRARTTGRKPSPVPTAATPADQWVTEEQSIGFMVELPSGNACRLRRTDFILTALKNNTLPNELAQLVTEMIANAGQSAPSEEAVNPLAVTQLLSFIDDVCCEVMLEPKCEARPATWSPTAEGTAWQPSPGAINVEKLSLEDKGFIFQVAMGGAADLAQFRAKQAKVVAAS